MASEAKQSTGSLKVEDWWSGLNALDYAGVVLTSLKAVAGVAPFGSQLQACIDLAQAIVDNVKDMQSFRASEDDLSKRVAETLRIIAEALQKRNRGDAQQLKRDLHPLEIVMQDITVFTSKQKTKNSLQRFIDAGDDIKKVQQFNSDLNDNLLQLHMKLMLDVDSGVKSMQRAQKKRHDELLDELGQLRTLVRDQKNPGKSQDNKRGPDFSKKPEEWKGNNDKPGRSSGTSPRRGKMPDESHAARKGYDNKESTDKKHRGKEEKGPKPDKPDIKGKAPERKEPSPRRKPDNKVDSDHKVNEKEQTGLKKSKSENDKNRGRRDGGKNPGLPRKPAETAAKHEHKERDNSDRASIASSAGSDVAVVGQSRGDRKGDSRRDGDQARGRGRGRGEGEGRGRGRGRGRGEARRGGRRANSQDTSDGRKGRETEEKTTHRKEPRAEQALLGVHDIGADGIPRPRFHSESRNEAQASQEMNFGLWRRNSMSNFASPWPDFNQGPLNTPFFGPSVSPILSPMQPSFTPYQGAMVVAPHLASSRSEGSDFEVPAITVLNPDSRSWQPGVSWRS